MVYDFAAHGVTGFNGFPGGCGSRPGEAANAVPGFRAFMINWRPGVTEVKFG